MPEKEKDFSKEEIPSITVTNRDHRWYWQSFNLPKDKKYFEGKTILDIGPGYSDIVEYIKKNYPECDIIPVEMYAFARKARLESEDFEHVESVAGKAQELPFKEESADEIWASWSMPFYADNNYEVLRSIYEMLRCLKKNGALKITPFSKPEEFDYTHGNRLPECDYFDLEVQKILKKLLNADKFNYSFYRHPETKPETISESDNFTFIIQKQIDSGLNNFKKYLSSHRKELIKQKHIYAKHVMR